MSNLENESVRKVRGALADAGFDDTVVELEETARSAEDAAQALDVELGAIVKSLVFVVGEQPVMALIAGDRRCREDALARALALDSEAELGVHRADADEVRAATGFSIGGVAPVALALELPMVLDVSLKRFDTVYAAAGHPHCVFATNVSELKRLTGAIVSYNVAEPLNAA
jgi:prolyl-tRNA editing enzyme YbaK/EbsC (Cys-tRNA(Pro) deacylase)